MARSTARRRRPLSPPNENKISYAGLRASVNRRCTTLIMESVKRTAVGVSCIAWLGELAWWLPSVEWRGQAPSCERDAKAQARLAAELLRFDEVLDQDASIRFDDAL